MAEVSKNGFDLIGGALHKLHGKGSKAFLGTLIFVFPLALMCMIPYAGWAIALFCWGVLETGYIRFMRRTMDGENPGFGEIFSEVRTGWFELYLGALMIGMFALGSAVILVPGVVLIGYYSLSLFTAEYYHIERVGEAMYQTAVRMDGNKTTMFSFKAIFYLFYFIVLAAAALSAYGVYLLWATSPVLSVCVAALAFLVFVLLWSWITVYHHATSEMFFQEILHNYEFKSTRHFREEVIEKKGEKEKAEESQEAPAEEVKEEPAKEVAPAKKPAAKKPAAKKAPAKKAPAKKPAAKK